MGRAGVVLAGAASLLGTGCTEDTLSGVDPSDVPGQGAGTVEIELAASEIAGWRDTTYVGYALASTSGVRLMARQSGAGFTSRVLGRFTTLPDSVFIEEDRLAVERFENARLRIILDTLASTLPETGAEVEMYGLGRSFESREASWAEAADGEPWTTPGGDLDALLGSLTLEDLEADTVFLPVAADTDSLLQAWLAADGEPGMAVATATDGTRLVASQVALVFDAKPVGRDTLIETVRGPQPGTFIFEPEAAPPAGVLRAGTLPAARAYMTFRLPETVDGLELRGALVNRATLVLTSSGEPPAPFAPADTLVASAISLLSNPFESGPKTPVGRTTGSSVELPPEALDGGEVELPLTALVQDWAAAEPDELDALNVGVRLLPEGGDIVYWEFGAVDDPERQPRIRMLVTPSTKFDLP